VQTSSAPAATGESSNTTRNVVLITGAGLTLVAATIGIVYWRKAAGADSDAKAANDKAAASYGSSGCGASGFANSSYCVDAASKLEDRNAAHKIETAAFVAAVLFAGGTVATWALWPHSLGSQGAMSVAPYVNSGAGGFLVDGRF
jgi:hypothetical protein